MPFDVDRFMAHEVTEDDRARNRALLKLLADSVEASKRLDALAAPKKMRVPRKGSKAWQFLQIMVECPPGTPAARINAMLPSPMDESTARDLAREWRGTV